MHAIKVNPNGSQNIAGVEPSPEVFADYDLRLLFGDPSGCSCIAGGRRGIFLMDWGRLAFGRLAGLYEPNHENKSMQFVDEIQFQSTRRGGSMVVARRICPGRGGPCS